MFRLFHFKTQCSLSDHLCEYYAVVALVIFVRDQQNLQSEVRAGEDRDRAPHTAYPAGLEPSRLVGLKGKVRVGLHHTFFWTEKELYQLIQQDWNHLVFWDACTALKGKVRVG